MTDLEITKLCAEAMGWRPAKERDDFDVVKAIQVEQFPHAPYYQYAPLKDGSSALALVKKFRINLNYGWDKWHAYGWDRWHASHGYGNSFGESRDLNHAICECVAKMQKAKTKETA